MLGDIKVNRIKSRHKAELALLGDVTQMAQTRVAKLAETAKNRVEARNIVEAFSALGKHTRANGFDPTRTFQHVANFDTEIWTLILDMFARYDDDGNQIDDGLLYKWNHEKGCLQLNKDFFFALVSYFEAQGISCDMRGRIKLT
jgi:hypothetical protein